METTPLSAAILRLFGDLGGRLAKRGVPPGAINAYLFGGCAVHLHARSRTSSDVDVDFDYAKIHKEDLVLVLADLPPVDYDDPEQGPSQLVYDQTYNTTLGPLHEAYRERAILLPNQNQAIVRVWLPAPEDLAVSKLGRLTEIDVEDIILVLMQPGASWEVFEQLATEAAQYYVGPSLTSNLSYVKKKWIERVRQ